MIVFFRKSVMFSQFIFMLLVFIGIYFLIKSDNTIRLNHKLLFPFVTAFSWAISGVAFYYLESRKLSIYTSIFIINFIILVLSFIYYKFKFNSSLQRILIKKNIMLGFLSGLTTYIGNVFYVLSLNYIHPAIASSIGSSQIFFNVIFSFFLLNEKMNVKQFISLFLILLGLVSFNIY